MPLIPPSDKPVWVDEYEDTVWASSTTVTGEKAREDRNDADHHRCRDPQGAVARQ